MANFLKGPFSGRKAIYWEDLEFGLINRCLSGDQDAGRTGLAASYDSLVKTQQSYNLKGQNPQYVLSLLKRTMSAIKP